MHVPIERDARSWRGDRGALRSTTALSGLFGTLPMLVVGAGMFGAGTAYANPEDGTVVSGDATIVQTSDTRLDIYQTSDQTMIDWRSFSIAAGEITNFYQPSSTSLAINRVTGNTISEIFGQLTANGQIMLLNTNGILFGPNSRIDVASLTASTLDISNDGFVEGQFSFSGSSDSTASVVNQGTITVKDGGLVALVAPGVANQGVIVANLGRVTLASGNAFTVDLFGDGLINLVADAKVISQALGADGVPLDWLVSNSGRITTDGGTVVLTVNAVQGILDNVINMDGIIQARYAVERSGEIVLFGGDSGIVRVAGTLDASGKGAGQTGGTVKVLGEYVGLFDGALIDVSGDAGGGTVLVGGNYKGQGSEPNAKVTYVDGGATINADAITSGDGGTVIVWSDETSRIYGSISVRGGSVSGDGGFVETSSKGYLEVTNAPDIGAGTGSGGWWLIDPSNIDITDTDAFTANVSGVFQSNNAGASTINVATLVAAIDGAAQNATIEVSTSAGTDSSEAGTITLTNALAANPTNTGVTLLFNADSNITINADLTAATNALNVTFTTTGDTVAVNNLITTNGGNFTVNASAAYTQANVDVNAGGGNILIEADTIALTNNTGDNALIATGTLTLRPTSTSQSIGIGTGAAGTFQLDDTEIVDLGGGFSSITIGRADGTHTIIVDGATFNDPVTIQAPSGGSITLNTATLIGAGDASITLNSGGTTTLNAGITTASQDITISDNVVLGANITLTTAGSGGNILISGTVNADANTGNRTFTLTAGTGTTEVTGAIGTTQAVESVTVTDASTATFGGAIDTRDGGVNIAATTISLASNVTTIDQAVAGSLTLTGAVTLTGDVRLDTDAATTDAALLVTGAVNADANTNNRIFALDSGTNTTTVTGAIGTTQAVESVTVDAASTATFGGAIDTRDGGVNIAATTISLASNVTTIDQAAAGSLTLTGAVTLTGNVRLDTDAATTDAAITVTGATNATTAGVESLTIDAGVGGGAVSLGAAGTTTALASLTATGATISLQNVTTTGTQSYTGAVTFNSDYVTNGFNFTVTGDVSVGSASSVTTSGGNIVITGTLSSTVNEITLDAGSGTVTDGGSFLAVNIGSTVFGTLIVGGSNVLLEGTVGGDTNNAAAAALVRLISGAGTFNIAIPLSLNPIDLGALIEDLASLDITIDVDTGALETTPAQVAFCTDVLECGINPDVFDTDFTLVEAAAGSEDAYQALPYISENFWLQIFEEEEQEQLASDVGGPIEYVDNKPN